MNITRSRADPFRSAPLAAPRESARMPAPGAGVRSSTAAHHPCPAESKYGCPHPGPRRPRPRLPSPRPGASRFSATILIRGCSAAIRRARAGRADVRLPTGPAPRSSREPRRRSWRVLRKIGSNADVERASDRWWLLLPPEWSMSTTLRARPASARQEGPDADSCSTPASSSRVPAIRLRRDGDPRSPA